jgi:hypothetical protein
VVAKVARRSFRGSSRFGTKGNGPRHIILAAAEAKPAAQPARTGEGLNQRQKEKFAGLERRSRHDPLEK